MAAGDDCSRPPAGTAAEVIDAVVLLVANKIGGSTPLDR
jgi:hypothetical protein